MEKVGSKTAEKISFDHHQERNRQKFICMAMGRAAVALGISAYYQGRRSVIGKVDWSGTLTIIRCRLHHGGGLTGHHSFHKCKNNSLNLIIMPPQVYQYEG
jgi:hypothetical protein